MGHHQPGTLSANLENHRFADQNQKKATRESGFLSACEFSISCRW